MPRRLQPGFVLHDNLSTSTLEKKIIYIYIKKKADNPDDIPTNFRMISLTLNIGKLYHTLESQRTMQFMLK